MTRSYELPFGFNLDTYQDAAGHYRDYDGGDVYFDAASSYLDRAVDAVLSDGVPQLKAENGVWHPSGFMVFRLGTHQQLGDLRLHVWPEGFRTRELRGRGELEEGIWDGDIHNHSWHVVGLNIANYQDKIFTVTRPVNPETGFLLSCTPQEIAANGLYRSFNATYKTAEEFVLTAGNQMTDELFDYAVYTATEHQSRHPEKRAIHYLKSEDSSDWGDFHAPCIPESDFAATLAFNSFRVTGIGPRILIGGEQSSYDRRRTPVRVDEWELAKESLAKCTL